MSRFSIIVSCSIFGIITQRKSLLIVLLFLEFIILGLALLMVRSRENLSGGGFLLLLSLFTLGAAEASIGLACLVTLIRKSGKDRLNYLALLKCLQIGVEHVGF